MTRSGNRRLWLIVMAVLVLAAFFTMRKAQSIQVEIASAEAKSEQLTRDLRAGNLFSAALADLDNLTIDENESTTLDILRHLNLEESSMEYETRARSIKPIGGTDLYIRRFGLSGVMSYADALNQADFLHNTNKVIIDRMILTAGRGFGDVVNVQIEGTLYGLKK